MFRLRARLQTSDRQRLHLNLGCPISALASRPYLCCTRRHVPLHQPGEKIRRFQPSAAASDYSTSRLSARCGGDERAGQWLHENGSVTRRKLVGVGAMDGAAAGLLRKCSICNEYGHRADNRRVHPLPLHVPAAPAQLLKPPPLHPLPLHVPAAHCAMWLRITGIREQKSLQD